MNEIHLYVDGSCLNNGCLKTSSMGAGIRLVNLTTGDVKSYSISLGNGSNNLAEILAVEEGLKRIAEDRGRTNVLVFSDSVYAISVLTLVHRARKHHSEVQRILTLMCEFNGVSFQKVKAHEIATKISMLFSKTKDPKGNIHADRLALKGAKKDARRRKRKE